MDALQALGSATNKALPNLSKLLLDYWVMEKAPAVRQALGELLQSRLALLKPEQMKELLPLLRHKDPDIVVVGLKVVLAKKEAAAEVAAEVTNLLEHDNAEVRAAALNALKAMGHAASKALPKLFTILDKTPKYERTSFALTIAGIVDVTDAKDAANVDRLVPVLVEGLHPESLRIGGEASEAAINQALLKIEQPAVDGIFTRLKEILGMPSPGADNVKHRATLYYALAKLGPSCKSKNDNNYKRIHDLWIAEGEKKIKDVIKAAAAAQAAMDSR